MKKKLILICICLKSLSNNFAISQSAIGLNISVLKIERIFGLNQTLVYTSRFFKLGDQTIDYSIETGLTQSLSISQKFGGFPYNLGLGVSFPISNRFILFSKINVYKFERNFDLLNFQGGFVACRYNHIKTASILTKYNILKRNNTRRAEPYLFLSLNAYKRGGILRDEQHVMLKESCSNPVSFMFLFGFGVSTSI